MSKKIGIIGFGTRSSQVIRDELKFFPEMELVAIADLDLEEVKEKIAAIPTLDIEKINLYENAIEMLDKEKLDGVFVATRCDLHASYATLKNMIGLKKRLINSMFRKENEKVKAFTLMV